MSARANRQQRRLDERRHKTVTTIHTTGHLSDKLKELAQANGLSTRALIMALLLKETEIYPDIFSMSAEEIKERVRLFA